jgi:hypothetical protein
MESCLIFLPYCKNTIGTKFVIGKMLSKSLALGWETEISEDSVDLQKCLA